MGEAAMTLGPEELQKIGDYVRLHLPEWMGSIRGEREIDLIERSIRVEEELKAQRGIMETRFEAVDRRFEAMDRRFESLQELMEARFEAVDRRFESMDARFESLQEHMETRFEAMQKQMDVRFEAVDKRFAGMQWILGLGFTLLAALMGVFNFF